MSEKGKLSKALLYAPENGFDRLPEGEKAAMHDYCESYKDFLNHGKTERLCVEYCIELAKQHGFVEFQPGMALKTGDKVYCNNRGKGIMLAVIGKEPLSEGANIAAAHTDAPRLDLKPRPLYEEAEMAYFKTHHYGGIRKYQWVTIPLELHGVVTLSDGTVLPVHIGDKPEDPQFIINDLLPHLGREQGKKPLNEAIPSESLNILVGSQPLPNLPLGAGTVLAEASAGYFCALCNVAEISFKRQAFHCHHRPFRPSSRRIWGSIYACLLEYFQK